MLFVDREFMPQLAMRGPVAVKKVGTGKDVLYSPLIPPVKIQSEMQYGSGDVPQSVLGAWYESHNFVPKDARS
ncbi:MAG: hypothetical protein JSS83_23580 [Cyanobacteria bacterium SZAS LIN-3]|nr:hypothetical protein [Cyanobacteria bacterium SZAS LIN-3]